MSLCCAEVMSILRCAEVDHVDLPVLLRGPAHGPLILHPIGDVQREDQLGRRSQIGQVDLVHRLSRSHTLQRQGLIDTGGAERQGRGHGVSGVAHGYPDLLP